MILMIQVLLGVILGRFDNGKGEVYEGEFVKNKKHRFGKFSKAGESYEGLFRDNKYHGKGILKITGQDTYDGEWVAGVQHGKGTVVSSNGKRRNG